VKLAAWVKARQTFEQIVKQDIVYVHLRRTVSGRGHGRLPLIFCP